MGPIFDMQTGHFFEVSQIARDECGVMNQNNRCDLQIRCHRTGELKCDRYPERS